MQAIIRTVFILLLAAIAAPAAAGGKPAAHAPAITVRDAWIRPPVVAGRPGALYFVIENKGKQADKLLSVSTPGAKEAEMHQSLQEGGVMTMAMVDWVDVPANGTLTFAPMGYHVMLYEVDASVTPGARIPATLTFSAAGPITIEAEVRSPTSK